MAHSNGRGLTPEEARLRLRKAASELESAGGLSAHIWRNVGIAAAAGAVIGMSPRLQRLLKSGLQSVLRHL